MFIFEDVEPPTRQESIAKINDSIPAQIAEMDELSTEEAIEKLGGALSVLLARMQIPENLEGEGLKHIARIYHYLDGFGEELSVIFWNKFGSEGDLQTGSNPK